MGVKSYNLDCSGERVSRYNRVSRVSNLYSRIDDTREEMEKETLAFIEAAKNFSFEWIQREMEINVPTLKSESYSKNMEIGEGESSGLSCPEDLLSRIEGIVEANLDRDDYWVHRTGMLQADISSDYVEFKKEKTRKDLTSVIRMVLGCVAEIFAGLRDVSLEGRAGGVWIKERGRRKYICILRFSDEMTASLNRYFVLLEELLALEYEKKEIETKIEKEEKKTTW